MEAINNIETRKSIVTKIKKFAKASHSVNKANVPSAFNRIEDKFIMNLENYEKFVSLLERHLPIGFPDKSTQYTKIESTYYDSVEMDFFRHHLMKLAERNKFRVRRYFPNGILEDNQLGFAELKSKINGVSIKERLVLSNKKLDQLDEENKITISNDIYKLNKAIPQKKIQQRVKRINELKSLYNFVPRISIQYNRKAYELDDLRVTLDTDINVKDHFENTSKAVDPKYYLSLEHQNKVVKMSSRFNNKENFIVEVKHHGHIPQWLVQFLEDNDVIKKSFSKFCWSMGKVLHMDDEL